MGNPVLINDLRKNWFRRRPVHAVALIAILIVVLTLFVASGVPAMFGFSGRNLPLWRFPDLILPIVAPVFAAGAFAKEHEQRTWQDVLLTRLSAAEIVSGKLLACLIPTVAMVIVLLPPFALVLIVSNIPWAMQPGPWMFAVAFRFLITAILYLTVGLVCSYHTTNARASLVVGYVSVAVYAVVSFWIWQTFFSELSGSGGRSGYALEDSQLLGVPHDQFSFTAPELFGMTQAILLSILLISYLLYRVRDRDAPNL